MKSAFAMIVVLLSLGVAVVGAIRLIAPQTLLALWPGVTFDERFRMVWLISVVGGLLAAWSNWRWFQDSLRDPRN